MSSLWPVIIGAIVGGCIGLVLAHYWHEYPERQEKIEDIVVLVFVSALLGLILYEFNR